MTHIKRIILFPLALVVLYLGILATVQVIIKSNIPAIQSLIKDSLDVQSVQIKRYINLPFFFVTARDIKIELDESSFVQIEKVRIQYSLIALLFRGPESMIRKVKITTINVDSSLGSITRLIPDTSGTQSAGSGDWIAKVNSRLKIDKIITELKVIGLIGAELQVNDLDLKWKNNQLWLDSNLLVKLKKGSLISYMKSAMVLDLHFTDIKSQLAQGDLQILDLNLGGVDLIENSSLPFSISNAIVLDLVNSPLSMMLSQTNGSFYFHTEKLFTLFYHRFDELYILEHMFDPGIYQGMIDLSIEKDEVKVSALVQNTNDSKTLFKIDLKPVRQDYLLTGLVESQKYGLGKIDLLFEKGNAFPSGTIITRDMEVIPGLAIDTIATVQAKGDTLLVRGKDLRMNGGYIGTTGALLTLETNGGVTFKKLPWYVNAPVEGVIEKIDYELNIGIKNVPGSAIVNIIGFDMFNLGKGAYQGKIRIFNEGPRFKIKGDVHSYYAGKRLVDVDLDLTDETLSLPQIYFHDSELWTSLVLDFMHPFKDRTLIKINGTAKLGEKIKFPLTGEVVSFIDAERASVRLRFDNAINLAINSLNNISDIAIKTKNYSMKTFGLPGYLDGDIAIRLNNSSLNNLGLNLIYKYNKRNFQIKLQTAPKTSSNLDLKQFLIAVDDEKIYGHGKLWETKNRLNAKVEFVRGGALKFESSFEKINGLLTLKNIMIKDFFEEKRDVFLTLDMNFSGDLAFPNYQMHKLSIINSVNSSPFSVSASGINRRPGVITVANLLIRTTDLNSRLSGRIKFKSQGLEVDGKGVLGYGGIFSTGFDANYTQTKQGDEIIYSLYNLALGRESINPILGSVNMKNNAWTFKAVNPANGIQGTFVNRSAKSWDIEANLSRLKGKSKGGIVNKQYVGNTSISFEADLKLLSFMDDVFKRISGKVKSTLDIEGFVRDPKFSGELNISNGDLSIVNLDMTISDFNGKIPLRNSKMLFEAFKIPSSTGVFLFDGYIEMSQFLISYIDLTLRPYPGEEAWLDLGMQTEFIKLLGNLYIKQVRLEGPPLHLNLTGEAIARNANIFVGLSADEEPIAEEGLIEGLIWDLKVNMGNGVKFGNQFIDTTLSAGQSLMILGSIGDGSLSLKGDVDVSRGVLTFLQQDFTIIEGSSASFSGQPGDPIPYVSIQTKTYTRDPDGSRIEVILTFEGKLTKITLKDFYAKNSTINRNELFALLGFQPLVEKTSGTNQSLGAVQNVAMGGWNALENTFIFNPIANTLRRTLGLDLVLIRSQALGNIFETTIFGSSTNIDAVSLIEGTSLTFGKYLFSNLFVEYELSFERNDLSTLGLEPMHSFGVGLDWQNFFLGWKYGPEELGTGLDYEHSLDFQFHQKF